MATKRIAVLAGVFVLVIGVAACSNNSGTPIFNGSNYDGWEGDLEWFFIQQKSLVAGSLGRPIPQNEFLCSKKSYSDFVLTASFKVVSSETNGGIQFRSQRVEGSNEVMGYQADIGQDFTGSLYDEHRRNTFLRNVDPSTRSSIMKEEGAWHDYRISAIGPEIVLSVDGIETVRYTEEDEAIDQQGLICVQIHSGPPGEVWYKDIKIEERTSSQ